LIEFTRIAAVRAARPPAFAKATAGRPVAPSHRCSRFKYYHSLAYRRVGRGRGVGRGLGVTLGVALGVGVAVGVPVGVGLTVALGDAVGVGVGVGPSAVVLRIAPKPPTAVPVFVSVKKTL
jgi:hypothetical protein